MLVWQNVYLSKCIIADPAVQSIRKVVIQYIRVRIKIKVKKVFKYLVQSLCLLMTNSMHY